MLGEFDELGLSDGMYRNHGKTIVLVLDGLGVGTDEQFSRGTLQSIRRSGRCSLPVLDSLALGQETRGNLDGFGLNFVSQVALPAYAGADSILGHMEIAGTTCDYPLSFLDEIALSLKDSLSKFGDIRYDGSLLSISDKAFVLNNIEAQPGTALNVLADSRSLSKHEWLEISAIVRSHFRGLRVIAQRGIGVNQHILESAMHSVESNPGVVKGVSVGGLGIYGAGFDARHLIRECGDQANIVKAAEMAGVRTTLIGKTSHIFKTCGGCHFPELDVSSVLAHVTAEMAKTGPQFIFANVQDIDLAGHSQNPRRASEVLELIDHWLSGLFASLAPEDLFILCADHGNDPRSGHGCHTREYVPVIMVSQQLFTVVTHPMQSLRHIASTVADSFSLEHSRFAATPLFRRVSA